MVPLYTYYPGVKVPRWSCAHSDDGFGNLVPVKVRPNDEVYHFLSQPADTHSIGDVIKAANELTRK